MSDEHQHHHHDSESGHDDDPHEHPLGPMPDQTDALPEDAGSQALSEALRSSFAIVKVVMAVLVVVFIGSGFFKVEQRERAVILRFGKPVGQGAQALLGPGLHWSWPYPIDDVKKIPYSQFQQVRSTVGWFNISPEKEALGQEPDGFRNSLNPATDTYAITGDGNILQMRATLIYRIDDPIRFEFEFKDAAKTVQDALDNALLEAAARFSVDDILTREIIRFQDTVRARFTELAQQENLGIIVEQCQVESKPPAYLKGAFDSVLTALSTRDKIHNEALSYENQVVSQGSAEAARLVNSAQAERVRLVGSVKADAKTFAELLPEYQRAPALFANILLVKEIGQVLTNVQDKVYLPERQDGKPRELRLQLSREPQKPPGQSVGSNQGLRNYD